MAGGTRHLWNVEAIAGAICRGKRRIRCTSQQQGCINIISPGSDGAAKRPEETGLYYLIQSYRYHLACSRLGHLTILLQ